MPPVTTRRTARPGRASTSTPILPVLKKALLYARVSSREQEREGFSIPAQQTLLREYASRNGFAIMEEFIDVETAKKSGRAAFTKMLALLKKHAAEPPVVLVEKTDRLYRNIKDWVTLDDIKVEIHLVKENVVLSEGSRSSEKFMHGIKVLMAKNYVDNLSEEVRKGHHQKASEGFYPGLAPVGYINQRENGKSRLALDPLRAVLVRSLFELYDRGEHSIEQLVLQAETIGLNGRQGGKLSTSVIHKMLRNPLYAGRFYWSGKEFVGQDPLIISWSLFERIQARLDGHHYTRATTRGFAYAGLITCGHCGSAVVAELHKEKYIYYHCGIRCQREKFIAEPKMTELLLAHVRRLVMPASIQEEVKVILKGHRQEVETDVQSRIQAATSRVERIGKLINAAYEDKLEGKIDDGFFQAKRAEWDRQRLEASEEVRRLSNVNAQSLDTAIRVFELANRAYDLVKDREPQEQRELLEILFSNFVLAEGRLSANWRKPFDILAGWNDDPKTVDGDSGDQNRHHSATSGWRDSNPRPSGPEPDALARLRYTPDIAHLYDCPHLVKGKA